MPAPNRPSRRSRLIAGALVLASAATLAVALALPTVTFTKLGSAPEIYSIYGGIESLWNDGNFVLAGIVFLFSIVFPVGKLLALGMLLGGRGAGPQRLATLHWLQLLGKWSMLDVFIIGLFVGAVRLGIAEASSRPGIHLFTAAILMSMGSTLIVLRLETGGAPRAVSNRAALRSWPARVVATAAAVALGFSLSYALLEVQKLLVFRNIVALYGTTRSLFHGGEVGLAVSLMALVIFSSVMRALWMLRVRWLAGGTPSGLRAGIVLDEWAMLDVFALGLLIVQVKLAELTTCTLMPGFWWVVAAAALAELDAWLYRRAATGGTAPGER